MKKCGSKEIWDSEWSRLTPESEIRMWDFYGLRQWVLKYTPRHGIVLEAGCGLGRYVFYLTELGIDCIGLDFSEKAIAKIQEYQGKSKLKGKFCRGDVKSLPFADNSLSGYISGGVIEHFVEGPQKALEEAFRVLRPGGVAIISTPSLSFSQVLLRIETKTKRTIKGFIKKIIKFPIFQPSFFQYWYTPRKLKSFVQNVGLKVVIAKGADLLYSFYELGYIPEYDRLFNKTISKLENTFIANIGAQSITIAYKPASEMYCFLCGELKVKDNNKMKIAIPICSECLRKSYAKYYIKVERPQLSYTHLINPVFDIDDKVVCEYCRREYKIHKTFEHYGFTKMVCPICLRISQINMELSNNYVQPIWRQRGR